MQSVVVAALNDDFGTHRVDMIKSRVNRRDVNESSFILKIDPVSPNGRNYRFVVGDIDWRNLRCGCQLLNCVGNDCIELTLQHEAVFPRQRSRSTPQSVP